MAASATSIRVRVIPRATRRAVVTRDGGLTVYVTEPAEAGRANAAVRELVSAHFGVRPRQVQIVRGERSRNKIIAIQRS